MTFKKRIIKILLIVILAAVGQSLSNIGVGQEIKNRLPAPLVYLRDVDPTILQDIKYATVANFTGRVVPGYEAGECILIRPAAEALSQVQAEVRRENLSLKVYDCFRPERAVHAFVAWSERPTSEQGTSGFYPRLKKSQLFSLGYIAKVSSHSRGIAVDLTLVPLPEPRLPAFDPNASRSPCNGSSNLRIPDTSVDMGTAFDCFDPMSHTRSSEISSAQRERRRLLTDVMEKHGFRNYRNEWWHFTYQASGAVRSYDFPIRAPPPK